MCANLSILFIINYGQVFVESQSLCSHPFMLQPIHCPAGPSSRAQFHT